MGLGSYGLGNQKTEISLGGGSCVTFCWNYFYLKNVEFKAEVTIINENIALFGQKNRCKNQSNLVKTKLQF